MGSEDEFSSDVSTSMDRNSSMMYPVGFVRIIWKWIGVR
jgi:hypothetical protein